MHRNEYLNCCVENIFKCGFMGPVISMIIGTAAAYMVSPIIYSHIGSEAKRIYYIYKNIHDSSRERPEIVVLGNSVVMNGIDCKQLSEGMDGNPVAWNLSSTGQLLTESILIFEELPETVRIIILGCHVNMIINSAEELSLFRGLPYKMFGYKITTDIIQTLDENGLKEDARNLTIPHWKDVLETRDSVLNAVDNYSMLWLRKDIDFDRSLEDMFYPSPYTKHVSQESIKKLANKLYSRRTAEMGTINPVIKNLCSALGEMARKRNCRFIFIIMPEQPFHKNQDEPDFYENLNKSIKQLAKESPFEVYDFRDLLSEEYFIDFLHPDSEGARILTLAIRDKIVQERK